MSILAIQELILKGLLDDTLLSHFIDLDNGQVTQKFECEYWDYKREFYNLDDPRAVAELATDVLAFHNTRGGYVICGITNDFIPIGIHPQLALETDSSKVNDKLRSYIGSTFHCKYAVLTPAVGGTHKAFAIILIPPRKGTAIPVGRNAPGPDPFFSKGQFFIRVNDKKKRAETDDEMAFLFSPARPELTVGAHQFEHRWAAPGYKLFLGDYRELLGKETRVPKVAETIDALVYDKWDIVLLSGVGGIGKTAVAIETTRLLYEDYRQAFGGIFSVSCKDQELTPYAWGHLQPDIICHDDFLREFLNYADWDGNIPPSVEAKEKLVRQIIIDKRVLLFLDNYETLESRDKLTAKFLKNLPPGARTLLTARHQPKDLPAMPIDIGPLTRQEAAIFALTEAATQRVSTTLLERHLDDVLEMSSGLPLAIKWMISCCKDESHLKELILNHRHGKPELNNLCQFCFNFEYELLTPGARKVLVVFPLFHWAPMARELAVAADLDRDVTTSALEELINFNLVSTAKSATSGASVYRMLALTTSFARTMLREWEDLEREARRRLKCYYGASMPILLSAAEDMVTRRLGAAARQYIDEEIIDRDPHNARAFYLRGQTFEQDLHCNEAVADYVTALTKVHDDPVFVSEIVLRILAVSKNEPGYSHENVLPLLKNAYDISKDPRVASEVARIYDIQGNSEEALRWYEEVFVNPRAVGQSIWEQAAFSLARYRGVKEGPEASLRTIREALRLGPQNRALARYERELAFETGELDKAAAHHRDLGEKQRHPRANQ
jgi:tetratricopeptide (TPR) repeat protein